MGELDRTTLFAKSALLPTGWHKNVLLRIEGGFIASVETGTAATPADERHNLILPAMGNLHSHAFQRAMAGLAETRGPTDDSFWSWRNVMYRFALTMSPDDVEAVASQLYMEMLEAGYSRVGEFHYLHHSPDGSHYSNIAEMAERIIAAASATGISLTLLPVFYAHSGFGGLAPVEGQRRFINSLDSYDQLMSECQSLVGKIAGAELGVAPHSLRAVTPQELLQITERWARGPIHIHIAEQMKEVTDCLAWSSARPVEWLLDNAPVDQRWCLIHATHMTETETRRVARSGAVAGLCPITEANLGDGIFPGHAFVEEGGRIGIGSDSNILISLAGELRQLEYSQRLGRQMRNVLAAPNESTGRHLLESAGRGGTVALGSEIGIEAGNSADLLSLNVDAVSYLERDEILDHWIFADGVTIDSVWVRGRRQVVAGRHVARDEINRRFLATMHKLLRR
ncbi:formimidoylglutamate deiminase [Agrobacterium vitis]|uniref:Formimidoylglutamate deiminase n=1 Tax=Agrobacterium vitis TaxID=373 RepID=A0A368NIR2_AGRVI|nr:formimidoylglutamate deiminase [Agrobacterium vitis]MCF1501975.1 formimidoylglutamate deiminase [Allorhizobium sp. Av2]KAA3505356.1 formimidoylglutamate deiminase [Agrobacterium vitis]KAA3519229.1 formimidoylglutamate deiminase [Agrobacterium vitis]MCF1480445.1 formimidoylglutamate deiminase [Agrobacterium vitis]MCM2443283.1 formimidoylglutamate deiminase [Agrobacterium vitis]